MRQISFDSLIELLKESRGKRAFITFHSIGDTDAVSSALALMKLFDEVTVATPDFITGNSKRILEKLQMDTTIIKNKFDKSAELVILLDVNNFEDCGSFAESLENYRDKLIIIDHHTPNYTTSNAVIFNDESYNSTASIIYDALKSLEVAIDGKTANLLATGIISDSAELRNAFPNTFIQIGELLQKSNTDYQSLLLEMHHIAPIRNRAEFIADLFGAKVASNHKILTVYGLAHMHANKIADDAIKIGADLAIFYSKNNKELSFSARLRPTLDKKYGIHLGRMMRSLAPLINGQGGGHPCAAGAYGSNTSDPMVFLDRLMAEINKKIETSS